VIFPRLYDYAASANCYKVRLLAARLGIELERVPVDIFAGETLTDDFERINPARTVPVLEVAPDRLLPESNAILLLLAEGDDLLPADPFNRAEVVRWLLYEQAEVVPAIGGLRFRLLTGRWTPEETEAQRRRRAAEEALEVLELHLSEHRFLVGDRCTVADISMFGYVHVAHEAGLPAERWQAVARWVGRVEDEPGHMNDLEPYPPNARPGAGRSIYD